MTNKTKTLVASDEPVRILSRHQGRTVEATSCTGCIPVAEASKMNCFHSIHRLPVNWRIGSSKAENGGGQKGMYIAAPRRELRAPHQNQ
jgi:hypothetical protein